MKGGALRKNPFLASAPGSAVLVVPRTLRSKVNHFKANLDILSRSQPELAFQLADLAGKCVTVFPSVKGLPTACYRRGEQTFPLHSQYDPVRESHQTLKKFKHDGADYIILLGFGLGYVLDALLEKHADASNHYFVVESDIEILKAAFEARDLSNILSQADVHFAWPPSGPQLAEQWQRFFDPVRAKKSAFIAHNPSVVLDPGMFKAAAEMIQSQTFQIFTDINTLVGKSQVFLDNFVQNVHKAAVSPGVAKFSGTFSGVPAVIVSAGPSLDKNIHELRGWSENALVLSTDTALKPLLLAGIDPHFVVSGDPSELNYRHVERASSSKALFVADATAFPAIFDEFEGRTITCIFENSALHSLSDLLGNKGTLRAWGSVATMALDFALLLGCNPIIFIGQDLAYTNGELYCSGLCFEEDWFAGILEPAEWRQRLSSLRSERQNVMAEDIFGRPVETTDKLTAYWNWMIKVFRNHPDVQFINATEGGILREGTHVMSLREALYRHCKKDLNLGNRVRSVFDAARNNSLLYPGIDMSAFKGEAAAIHRILDLGIALCQSNGGGPAQNLLKRLEATKDSIYYNPRLAPLLDCLNQMGNVTFLRKRNNLTSQKPQRHFVSDIKDIYLAYFMSIRQVLAKIDDAIGQIESNFSTQPDSGPSREGQKRPINSYSKRRNMSIS